MTGGTGRFAEFFVSGSCCGYVYYDWVVEGEGVGSADEYGAYGVYGS